MLTYFVATLETLRFQGDFCFARKKSSSPEAHINRFCVHLVCKETEKKRRCACFDLDRCTYIYILIYNMAISIHTSNILCQCTAVQESALGVQREEEVKGPLKEAEKLAAMP